MKTYFLSLAFIFSSSLVLCQTPLDSALRHICVYRTGNSKYAKGIDMQLKIPCAWQDAQEERPGAAFNYRFQIKQGLQLTNCMLVVERPTVYTNEEKKIVLNMEIMRNEMSKKGMVHSFRHVSIDGEPLLETEITITSETPSGKVYVRSLMYNLLFENKLVNLSYSVGSYTMSEVSLYFEKSKLLFRTLATDAILLNKWK